MGRVMVMGSKLSFLCLHVIVHNVIIIIINVIIIIINLLQHLLTEKRNLQNMRGEYQGKKINK